MVQIARGEFLYGGPPLLNQRGRNTICFFVLGFCEYNCGGAKPILLASFSSEGGGPPQVVEGTILIPQSGIYRIFVKQKYIECNAHIECVAYIDCRYVCFTTNSIYYCVIRYINLKIYSIYFAEAK